MAKVTLDMETFKALSSDTRLSVLRALDERRKTGSEIARDLGLNKATVHEHMQVLLGADLVRKRDDEGRKWIYYELTWQGQKLLHPEAGTTFSVLLALSTAAAGGSIAMAGRALGWWWEDRTTQMSGEPEAFPLGVPEEDDDTAAGGQQEGDAPEDSGGEDANAMRAEEDASGDAVADDSGGLFDFDDGFLLSGALFLTALLFFVLAMVLRYRRPVRSKGENETYSL